MDGHYEFFILMHYCRERKGYVKELFNSLSAGLEQKQKVEFGVLFRLLSLGLEPLDGELHIVH